MKQINYRLIVTIFSIISLLINAVLFQYVKKTYTDLRLASVFPTHQFFYYKANLLLPSKTKTRVVLFGDSRIQDWNPLPFSNEIELINRGIGGETTAQLLARIEQDVFALKANAVILQIGINDLVTLGVANEHQQTDIIEQCKTNIDLIVNALTQKSIYVILLTIIPPTDPSLLRLPVWTDLIKKQTELLNKQWLNLTPASTSHFLQVIDTESLLTDKQGHWLKGVNKDTLHLTSIGYQKLNPEILVALKKTGLISN